MDNHFADRIDYLCKQDGLTIKELERKLGFGNRYIVSMTKKGYRPKIDRLEKIANYFHVSPEYLLGEEQPTTESAKPSNGILIPVLGRVAAGIPITAVENIVGYEEISKKQAATGEFFALRISGDSMSPLIQNGDIVIVKQQNDAENNDIVIALINGADGVCKKLHKTPDSIILMSLNTAYEPLVFTHSEIDSIPVKILGKVVELRRPL